MSKEYREKLIEYLSADRKRAERIGLLIGRSVERKVGPRVFNESLKQCKRRLRNKFGDAKWRGYNAEERDILQSDCTGGVYKYLIKEFEKGIRR